MPRDRDTNVRTPVALLVAFVALLVTTSLAHAEPPNERAGFGIIPFELAGYQGGYKGFSDAKLELVGTKVGLAGEYVRAYRYFEVAGRLDIVRVVFEPSPYRPDALHEARTAIAFAGKIPWSTGAFRVGFDLGYVFGMMTDGDDHPMASGFSASAFLGAHGWNWKPWGWYADVTPFGFARVEGAYGTDMFWALRLSLGAIYVW